MIIGIDLGTTNSLAAYYGEDGPRIIPNRLGKHLTPSVVSMDEDELLAGELPPTFYCYGTRDPFYSQFEAQYELMTELGCPVRRLVLEGWPHGSGGDWIEDYASWLESVFAAN